jgi:hypothetical protein
LSINGLFANTYTKSAIDLSINGLFANTYTKSAIDLSINGLFANTYTKSAIDLSINGLFANTISRLTDVSLDGNVIIGSATSTRSLAINKGIDPAYSLDISGDVRITETGPGTSASGTTGTLVLSHTATNGRSSITFTSPSAATDYGYIQYHDNNNPSIGGETNGGLMEIGVERNDGSGNIASDRISLYASNGTGNVGINTRAPEYHLDVSGTLAYSNVTEKLINNLGTVGATLSASFGEGLIRYITAFGGATTTLTITNIPTILNRSYVFTFIYVGVGTTSYFNAITLTMTSGATGTPTVKGPFTAPASGTTCYVQQFYVFITNITTMASNTVIQTLTTYA